MLEVGARCSGQASSGTLTSRCTSAARASVDEAGRHCFKLDNYGDVEGMLGALRAAGCRIVEMEVAQPDLEEVFVNIMGGQAQQ